MRADLVTNQSAEGKPPQATWASKPDTQQQVFASDATMVCTQGASVSTSDISMNVGIWNHLNKNHPIKRWSKELTRACHENTKISPFDGLGVTIECQDEDLCRSFMQQVAHESGWMLREVSETDLLQDGTQLTEFSVGSYVLVFIPNALWPNRYPDHVSENSFLSDGRSQEITKKLSAHFERMSPSSNIVVVACVFHFNNVPESLRSPGAFDRRITIEKPEPEILAHAFLTCLGTGVLDDTFSERHTELGAMLFVEYGFASRRLSLLILALRRRAWREQRSLQFKDIYELVAFGTGENPTKINTPEMDRMIATHEAGHAVMEFLTSEHRTPPVYCTIVTRDHFAGLSMPSFEEQMVRGARFTFDDCLQRIQVGLAGRAAEQILLGIKHTSAGLSEADLEAATQIGRDMFQKWGLPSEGFSDADIGSGLMRIDFETSPRYKEYIDRKISRFLQQQYQLSLQTLRDNKEFLVRVVETLLTKKSMVREDFVSILLCR